MRIRKILFCGAILVSAIFSMFSLSTAEKRLESLNSVDLITVSSYVKDGVLSIKFFYKNRDEDKYVYWKEGTVSCQCKVYEDVGNKKKKQKIIGIDKKLKRYDQRFYLDVPKQYLNKGKKAIIECSVNIGYKTLNVTDGGVSLDD